MALSTLEREIGARLRELREARGVPREQLAMDLGMSAGNIRWYESGRNQLRVAQIPIVAQTLRMRPLDLVAALLEDHNAARERWRSA